MLLINLGCVIVYDKKVGISEILAFGGKFGVLTFLECILSGISDVLSLMPFVYIWFIARGIFWVFPNVSVATNLVRYWNIINAVKHSLLQTKKVFLVIMKNWKIHEELKILRGFLNKKVDFYNLFSYNYCLLSEK